MECHVILFLLGFFPLLVFGALHQKNCSENTDGRTLSCYTCMGRDSDNCMNGLTCCSGSCFKLVDEDHDMIVKGCTSDNEEDASMKVRTLDMTLYWVNDEKVRGRSYFCQGTDFCNDSSIISLISSIAIVPLLRLLL